MAADLFTDAILAGRPIQVSNAGQMSRDFTYIDDIVPAIVAAAETAPPGRASIASEPATTARRRRSISSPSSKGARAQRDWADDADAAR
jgi:UDP-glucuronate 4-epimerase